jgi:hypothetical protein
MAATRVMLLVLICGLTGCAPLIGSIPPTYVSPMAYQRWDCPQLGEEAHRLRAALTQAAERQEQAHNKDALAVVLIGLPLASMSGQSIAPEIGRLKGEHEALYRVAVEKGCATEDR